MMKKLEGKAPSPWWMLLIAFTSLYVVACPKPAEPQGLDAGDGMKADAAASATCDSWCKHATTLGCAASKPTKAGASCTEVCGNVQTGVAKFNLKCRVAAKSCAEADSCE